MAEIMVRQWSFCPKCKGQALKSCPECKGNGTVVALIPLMSLPAGGGSFGFGLRGSYAKAQKDFIEYQAKVSAASSGDRVTGSVDKGLVFMENG